jgi:hypothetical protein
MELAGATAVFEALNRAGIDYLVVGGLAVNAHGYVRMTMDIDLVVSLEPGNITRALYALAEIGYRPAVPITPEQFAAPANRSRWMAEKGMRVLKLWSERHPLCPVDIFVQEPFDFAVEHRAAKRFMLDEDLNVPVVRLSALLALKEQAARPQDIADIAALREVAHGRSSS